MGQRHKHADVIIAWAEGAEIEVKVQTTGDWKKTETPSWQEDYEYRIKPPAKKYRVALFQRQNYESLVVACNSPVTADNYESLPDFVRWLTDWIKYEE